MNDGACAARTAIISPTWQREWRGMLEELPALPELHCRRCGYRLRGQLRMAAADVDQAFESCAATSALLAWWDVVAVCTRKRGRANVIV